MTFWLRYRRGIIWLVIVIGAIGLAAVIAVIIIILRALPLIGVAV